MNSPLLTTPGKPQESSWTDLCVLSLLGALLSIAVQGFSFGVSNNVFHLAVVGQLYDLPQFKDDAFVQSMRHYASLVWQILHYVIPQNHAFGAFILLHIISRFISFAGFLACAQVFGIGSRRTRAVFVLLLCFTSLMQNISATGYAGLFIDFFTHSEINNGLALFMLFFAFRARFTEAFAINGIIFSITAFMAVWNAVPLGLIAGYLLYRRQITLPQMLKRMAWGLALFAVLSAPAMYMLMSNPEFGKPAGFNYAETMRFLVPQHFFFDSNPSKQKALLAVLLLIAPLSLIVLGKESTPVGIALLGYVLVYASGLILPSITDYPLFINLHLLRVAAFVNILTTLCALSVTVRWLCSADKDTARLYGALSVLALCTITTLCAGMIPLLIAYLVLRRRRSPAPVTPARSTYWIVPPAHLLLLSLSWLPAIQENYMGVRAQNASVREWTGLGQWAYINTPDKSLFLIPIETYWWPSNTEPDEQAVGRLLKALIGNGVFEYYAKRSVWVNVRHGGALLWSPSYYPVWHKRIDEVRALSSFSDKMKYAASNNISYIVTVCSDPVEGGNKPIYATEHLCLFSVR